MTIDPDLARYETDVVLLDGGTVHIRPIRPSDGPLLAEGFARQSAESIYYRFFSPKPRLSEQEVAYFTQVDYIDRFALVAVTGELGIAVARYDRNGEGATHLAEVAFFVDEQHRKRGLSTVMLEHLALAARDHGITGFTATVLPDNHKMLRVFRDAGWKLQKRFEDGVIEVVFPIEPTSDSVEAMLARDQWAEARSIERILAPGSVAVVGVGPAPDSVGAAVLAKLRTSGFAGPIHAVAGAGAGDPASNGEPEGAERGVGDAPQAEVEAMPATDGWGGPLYPSLDAVPDEVDLVVIAVPAPEVATVARTCAARGAKAMVVLSAGFAEAGATGAARQQELLQITRDAGMRLVGPNCIGVFNTAVGLDATFTPHAARPGRVAFQSQSGGLGIALIEWSRDVGVGLSSFVSVGNKADVSGNDLIQYWAQDEGTDVILLYLESFGNPRKFARLARRVSQSKPIVAVKSGRTTAGTRAASSHSAAPATSTTPDDVVSDLFEQAGIIRVDTLEELLDTAQVLATQPLPAGNRVAIIGNAGGPGILAADACENAGLEVARLTAATATHVRGLLGADAVVRNPIDMAGAATAEHYAQVLELVLADDQVDAVIVLYTPPVVSVAAEVAAAVARVSAPGAKPVVANFLASREQPEALAVVSEVDPLRRVPSFRSPEPAARALGRVARYAAWRNRDVGTVPDLPVDRVAATGLVHEALAAAEAELPVDGAEASADLGRDAGATNGSPTIGGRRGGRSRPVAELDETTPGEETVLLGPDATRRLLASYDIEVGAGAGTPDDEVAGRGIVGPSGEVHAAVGVFQDPAFGPLLVFGLGGLTTELLADRTARILPLTDTDAREVVRSRHASPLLFGYGGATPVRADLLEGLLLRVSALAEAVPEVASLDLNPVVVTPDGLRIERAEVHVARFRTGPIDQRRSLD